MFIMCLLCCRYCSKCWWYGSKQNKSLPLLELQRRGKWIKEIVLVGVDGELVFYKAMMEDIQNIDIGAKTWRSWTAIFQGRSIPGGELAHVKVLKKALSWPVQTQAGEPVWQDWAGKGEDDRKWDKTEVYRSSRTFETIVRKGSYSEWDEKSAKASEQRRDHLI